jgi:cysteine-rich repeat protein
MQTYAVRLILALLLVLTGCRRYTVAPYDAGTDADLDSAVDAMPEGDSSLDRSVDAMADQRLSFDVVTESGQDALEERVLSLDAGADSAADATARCGDGLLEAGEECDDDNTIDGDACTSQCKIAPPRPVGPSSAATVMSRRPLLRWANASGVGGAHIQICRDRGCAREVTTFDAVGSSGAPGVDLPAGVVFWRAFGRSNGAIGSMPSKTWEFTVGPRSTIANTSFGPTLDVNGDGFADVVVGAFGSGKVYVYLGGATAPIPSNPSFTLLAPNGAISFGSSVACVGDLNGDGFSDIAVGADGDSSAVGKVYVYLGNPVGVPVAPSFTLTSPNGSASDFGFSVANAGDVNGDGFNDLVVGADSSGTVYLYLGGTAGLSPTPSNTITGPEQDSFFGTVNGADVNGDGFSDVIVGASANSSGAGQVYVYFGSPTGPSPSPVVGLSSPIGGVTSFGEALANLGDINGDGYADFLVGASLGTPGGHAHLYLGSSSGPPSAPSVTLSAPDGGLFGSSVAGVGDINGDGYPDVAVGAQGALNFTGKVYLYLGNGLGIAATPSISLTGPDAGQFGFSLAGSGDVNGDGFSDLLVGASNVAGGAGRAYVYTGGVAGLPSSPSVVLSPPDGPGSAFGYVVAFEMPTNVIQAPLSLRTRRD